MANLNKILLLTLAVFGVFFIADNVKAVGYSSGWAYSVEMEINPDKVATTSAETDFPVLFTADNLPTHLFDNASSTGCDIRFTTDAEGTTETAFEIVNFETGTDAAEIWVKVPSLSGTATTSVWAWYGNSSADCYAVTDTYGRNNVWDDNYVMVHHLSGASYSVLEDSTGNGNTWDSESGTPQYNQTGKWSSSKAIVLDGATDEWLYQAYTPSGYPYTLESWYKTSRAATTWTGLAEWSTGSSYRQGYGMDTDGDLFMTYGASKYRLPSVSAQVDDNNWKYVVATFNGTTPVAYLNTTSISLGAESGPAVATAASTLYLGSSSLTPANYEFPGTIDEFRISDIARSSDWLTTVYNNQNSPATFALAQTPVAYTLAYASDWGYKTEIEINPAYVATASSETDFPVLLTQVNFPSTMFDNASSTGCDIRFSSDTDGTTEIPYEKVSYTVGVASTTEIWVKIPTLSGTATTSIWVWYGNSEAECYAITDTYGAQNVWASHYKAVYHMNDLTSTTIKDSTSNANTGTKASANNPNTDTGKIGQAQYFDGASTDYVSLPNDIFSAISSGSVSAWAKVSSTAGTYHMFGSGASLGLYFGQNSDNKPYIQYYPTPNTAYKTTNVLGSGFSHICWKSSGSAWSASLNGASETLVQIVGTNSGYWYDDLGLGADVNYLGRTTFANYYFKGWIDEWRLSTNQLTTQWITTEYNNQNSPSTFAIQQGEEPVTPPATGSGEGYIILFE